MKNYLYAIVFLIIFTSNLHAQCKRGEQLRITNDVEIKVVDCREATRLFIMKDGIHIQLNMNRKIDVLNYLVVLLNIIGVAIGS